MFFILSKVFDFLLSPLIWITIIFLMSILVKGPKLRKRFIKPVVKKQPMFRDEAIAVDF
jgi:hypothetical protein